MSDRAWSNYPVGRVGRVVPEMPGAVRGTDPVLGPYWEQVTEFTRTYDRGSYWVSVQQEEKLVRWYDQGTVDLITRKTVR